MSTNALPPQSSLQANDPDPYLQHEHWTRQQLEDYQARALQACREYAYARSPFYQCFHRGRMDRPLQELPVLTKAMLMEHFDEVVTDRTLHLKDIQEYLVHPGGQERFLNRYRVMVTSGSTGQPGVFLRAQAEGAVVSVGLSRFPTWAGVPPGCICRRTCQSLWMANCCQGYTCRRASRWRRWCDSSTSGSRTWWQAIPR